MVKAKIAWLGEETERLESLLSSGLEGVHRILLGHSP